MTSKVHLRGPRKSPLSMCGRRLSGMVIDPKRVTCKRCTNAYSGNELWYKINL